MSCRTSPRRPLTVLAAALSMLAAGAMTLAAPLAAGAATAAGPIGGPELASTTVVVHLPAGVPPPPVMPAKGYLLADLTTGQILVAKDVHRRMLPASTLKVLTALTLLPRLSQTQVYTARRADEDIDGSKVGIVAGSPYTVHQLFLGMLLSSGNDAANALANAYGGVPETVQLMQQTATDLGALDTSVHDPSGLDAAGQLTSAYDLALVARAAMQRADFRSLVATRTASFPGGVVKGKRVKGFQIQNHNSLLNHYPGAIGVKTGYTVHARWTYVGAARRGDQAYLVTELGLDQQGWKPTMKLLDWAFAHGGQATPVGRLVAPGEVAAEAVAPASATPGPAAAEAALTPGSSAPGIGTRIVGGVGIGCAAAILLALGVIAVRRRRA